jgi:uncharacterized membrane protein YeaQ/YmgE (transglycosylase-associated protein family)
VAVLPTQPIRRPVEPPPARRQPAPAGWGSTTSCAAARAARDRAGRGLLTTALGIAGAFAATFVGQAVGWYAPDQGAGFIAATLGSIVVLFIWSRIAAARAR